MNRRGISLVVLAAFALWATGIARRAHEEFGHHAGEQAALIGSDAVGDGGQTGVQPAQPSHDDCAICQMLAVMTVNQPLTDPAPPAPAIPMPRRTLCLPDLPYACHVAWLLPPRGPPAVFDRSHVR